MTGIDEMNSLHACQPLQPLQQMQTLESMPIQGMQDMQMQSLMVVDPMTQACGHHDQAHALADNMFWGLLGFNVGVGVGTLNIIKITKFRTEPFVNDEHDLFQPSEARVPARGQDVIDLGEEVDGDGGFVGPVEFEGEGA